MLTMFRYKGVIQKISFDNEGEWLTIAYSNRTKQIQRNNTDIRALKPPFDVNTVYM